MPTGFHCALSILLLLFLSVHEKCSGLWGRHFIIAFIFHLFIIIIIPALFILLVLVYCTSIYIYICVWLRTACYTAASKNANNQAKRVCVCVSVNKFISFIRLPLAAFATTELCGQKMYSTLWPYNIIRTASIRASLPFAALCPVAIAHQQQQQSPTAATSN